MPIPIVCPCGARLKAPSALAGKAVTCPRCKGRLKVPSEAPSQPDSDADVLPAEAPARGRRPAKSQGFPLWILAVLIPACALLMVCCAGGIGLLVVFSGRPTGGLVAGGAGAAADLTRDPNAVARWNLETAQEITSKSGGNEIRRQEMWAAAQGDLERRLVGQEVRWRFKVLSISQRGVSIDRTVTRRKDVIRHDRFGTPYGDVEEYTDLVVEFSGWRHSDGKGTVIDTLPMDKLRSLSVGDLITVVGEVESIKWWPSLTIKIKDAKVE